MRALVTGAGGFIGSHLVEALVTAGHEVRAMARYSSRDTYGWLDEVKGCSRVRGDVTDALQMRQMVRGMDRVYHLAALGSVPYSFDAPAQFIHANTVGTMSVALACAEYGVGMVHTSTSEVYGPAPVPQDETSPTAALSPYAASKIGADQIVNAFCATRGLNAVILRPFNTYGPRQSARAVIPRVILRCQDPEADVIELGNVHSRRDFVYVSDTVAALMAVTPSDCCETFVAATGMSFRIEDVAYRIADLCGRPEMDVSIGYDARSDGAEVWHLRGVSSRLTEVTGWTPIVSLNEGLAKTIEWFAARDDQLVPGMV